MNRYDIILGRKPPPKPPKPAPELAKADSESYYLGLDISLNRTEATAIAICHVRNSDCTIMIDRLEERFPQDTREINIWLRELGEQYNIKQGYVDQYHGMAVLGSGININIFNGSRTNWREVTNFYNAQMPISGKVSANERLFNISPSEHMIDALKLSFWAVYQSTRLIGARVREYPRYYSDEATQDFRMMHGVNI